MTAILHNKSTTKKLFFLFIPNVITLFENIFSNQMQHIVMNMLTCSRSTVEEKQNKRRTKMILYLQTDYVILYIVFLFL
jgi:hypothetical protein